MIDLSPPCHSRLLLEGLGRGRECRSELLGIAPTGRRVRWDAVDVYRLRDGKITEEWAADDLTASLDQVGAYTPPWLS
jgi:hypothetical protein